MSDAPGLIRCGGCGVPLGRDDYPPNAGVRAHLSTCEKHPLRSALAAAEARAASMTEARDAAEERAAKAEREMFAAREIAAEHVKQESLERRRAEAAESEAASERQARERAEAALREAVDFAAEGWAYASEYFRDKWGYEETMAKLRAALGEPAARGGSGGGA